MRIGYFYTIEELLSRFRAVKYLIIKSFLSVRKCRRASPDFITDARVLILTIDDE